MADDDTGGTLLGFPRITIPGALGGDPVPAAPATPVLRPLAALAPPASLSVADSPDLSGESEVEHHESGYTPGTDSSGHSVAAMSTVMMAGIAVSAMRGSYHVAAYIRARAEHHRAIADKASAAAGKSDLELERARIGADGARRMSRIQSGPEFGRQARNGGGTGSSGSGSNSARNGGAPALFGSGGASGARGGGNRNPPSTASGSALGGRSPAAGSPGGSSAAQARRGAQGGPDSRARTGPNSGPATARNTGPAAAARERLAGRIASGPEPNPRTVTGAVRGRVADRITGGPAGPNPRTITGAARVRVADRIANGPRGPQNSPPGALAGALRTRAGRILDDIDNRRAAPKVDLRKKVDLTKKKPPTPAAGTSAPKVDLTKKVNLNKKRKAPGGTGAAGATGTGPGPAGPGPAAGAGGPGPAGAPGGPGPAGPGPGAGPGGPGAAGGFGPPPGWTHAETITVERADAGPGASKRRPAAGRAAALGPSPTPTRGAASVSVPVPRRATDTQYADSDLTIYDVIEADSDMAEEIMQGAADAREAADGCETLIGRLEALHARIVELKVPGVLEGWVLNLVDKATTVKALAEAVAEKIPAAAEAIANAGANAESRHRPLADVTRDMGHAAPAERDYHNE